MKGGEKERAKETGGGNDKGGNCKREERELSRTSLPAARSKPFMIMRFTKPNV